MSAIDRRYAEALVDVAEDNESLNAMKEGLRVFVEIYNKQPEFVAFFLSPQIGKKEKNETLQMMFDGSDNIILSFLQLLVDKGRISHLPGIYKEYVDIADQRKKVLNINIRTFATIDDVHLEKLREKYRKEYNVVDVKTTICIEPELLGGIVVQIGDRVIDGSLKSRLQRLKDTTTKNEQLRVIWGETNEFKTRGN